MSTCLSNCPLYDTRSLKPITILILADLTARKSRSETRKGGGLAASLSVLVRGGWVKGLEIEPRHHLDYTARESTGRLTEVRVLDVCARRIKSEWR